MFGTLRYDAQNDDTHFIERTTDPLNRKGEGQRPRYSACDKCRAKKQRCGGRRDGCERCIRTSSECVYSLQGKGRGRRRRDVTNGNKSSLGNPSQGSAKHSTADKTQQRQVTAPGELAQKAEDSAGVTMTSYLPADKWEKGFATSGPIQGHMPLGFDGQIIDDYLGSDYDSTLPAQHDFDPDFYFASHCESLENTPVDYLSDISSVFEQPRLLHSRSDFGFSSYVSQSPLSSLVSYSDGLPSPQSTPQACPATPGSNSHQTQDVSSSAAQENHRCLNAIVMVLEDLEIKARHVDSAALDSILVSQKEALGRCNSALKCLTCSLRPECILLLGMVTERLASLCELIVAKYLEVVNDGTSFRETDVDGNHHSRGKLMDDVKMRFGGYEIEKPDERVRLVRLLIVMRLQGIRKFIEGVATVAASRGQGNTHMLKVQAAEQRLAKLIQRIRQSRA